MHRFIPKPTVNTYKYVNNYMTRDEFDQKIGNVKLKIPQNPIKEGSFPNISLSSTQHTLISIAEIAMENNVVLFYYPGDKEGLKYPELAGCTPEACQFRNAINEFESLNTQIFGISFQSSERQSQFIESSHLNFTLLSDENRILAKQLGLPYWKSKNDELYPCRQTYIIQKGNLITKIFANVDPKGHIEEVLEEIKKLQNIPRLI